MRATAGKSFQKDDCSVLAFVKMRRRGPRQKDGLGEGPESGKGDERGSALKESKELGEDSGR